MNLAGEVQAVASLPSTLQRNVTCSFDENCNSTVARRFVLTFFGGAFVIVVSGGVESQGAAAEAGRSEFTVNVRLSGVASMLFDASIARTSKVCEPFVSVRVSLPVVPGPAELQGANTAPS